MKGDIRIFSFFILAIIVRNTSADDKRDVSEKTSAPEVSWDSTTTQSAVAQTSSSGSSQTEPTNYKQNHMSCFVCSTMDYPGDDNSCRKMPSHHYRHLEYHHHRTQNYNQQQQQQHQAQPTTTAATTSTDPATKQAFTAAQSQSNYEEATASSPTTTTMQTTTLTPFVAPSKQSQFIKTRPCVDDENFCSVVSVVRIEYVNDTLTSKFWALERNCSKSCNTGCMLIGERVRLRVCSQCCRTPNCNVGTGSSSNSSTRNVLELNQYWALLLMMALIHFKLLSLKRDHL